MITLKKNCDRRISRGHLWIFSNEIKDPQVSSLEPGSVHELRNHAGEFLGMVYVNPASLITARILSRTKVEIDADFIHGKIASAVQWRKMFMGERDHCRLIYSESDRIPGLIVDKYGDILVVQSLTAGMDKLLDFVVETLVDIVNPSGIFLRNDSHARELEGLEQEKRTIFGNVPDKVTITSGSLKFLVDVMNGQKTGYFLDQEFNRMAMSKYVVPDARVLDMFCYTGAWGLHAAAAGASEITAVDSSRPALDAAIENAQANGLLERFFAVRDQAIDFLKKTKEKWDLIILDPPSFIKSKTRAAEGQKGYIDVNRRALGKLKPGGILITCSCSHHLDLPSFEQALSSASIQSGKELRILEVMGQGPDHPVLLAMPESRYLKVIVAQAFQPAAK